eukprot:15149272-Alexandrium_andersonii.AAC.1
MAARVVHMQHAAPSTSRFLYMDDRMVWLRERPDHLAGARARFQQLRARNPKVPKAIASAPVAE